MQVKLDIGGIMCIVIIIRKYNIKKLMKIYVKCAHLCLQGTDNTQHGRQFVLRAQGVSAHLSGEVEERDHTTDCC